MNVPEPQCDATVHLSYSLTRLQRVPNPLDRLPFVVGGTFYLLVVLIIPFTVPWPSASVWEILGVLATFFAAAAFGLLVFLRPMRSFFLHLFSNCYINTLTIGNDVLFFGVDEENVALPTLKNLTATMGVCGTMMIRNAWRGYTIVLPREAIPFAELKRLIEKNRTDKRAEQPPSP